MEKLFEHIIANNSDFFIAEKIDEYMHEYVDDDWADDFEDIYEAYSETGRGSAESQALNEVITWGVTALGLPELSTDDHCDLFDKLAEHWNICTE